ncbi:MAG: hypothetical protein GTO18_14245 [Anaerolineales bacterium]|nr:hypothetical protein [Anaerolineales bacterium]
MSSEQFPVSKPPWVQLYEARRPTAPVRTRPRGRPPRMTPRKATVVHLTEGERREIDAWKERLSPLLGRKVSLGETAGILARICSARLPYVTSEDESHTLSELVSRMVGEN